MAEVLPDDGLPADRRLLLIVRVSCDRERLAGEEIFAVVQPLALSGQLPAGLLIRERA
jgi:hypothetical protein